MTPDQLTAAKAACEGASAGPWPLDGGPQQDIVVIGKSGLVVRHRDAAFISLSRTALPAALEFIEELMRERFYNGSRDLDGDLEGWFEYAGQMVGDVNPGEYLVATGELEARGSGFERIYRPIEQEKRRG